MFVCLFFNLLCFITTGVCLDVDGLEKSSQFPEERRPGVQHPPQFLPVVLLGDGAVSPREGLRHLLPPVLSGQQVSDQVHVTVHNNKSSRRRLWENLLAKLL